MTNQFHTIVNRVYAELRIAQHDTPPIHSYHEGYAVIKEELDEMWDAIKTNDTEQAAKEAIQVAAMAIRFLTDLYETQET